MKTDLNQGAPSVCLKMAVSESFATMLCAPTVAELQAQILTLKEELAKAREAIEFALLNGMIPR